VVEAGAELAEEDAVPSVAVADTCQEEDTEEAIVVVGEASRLIEVCELWQAARFPP
jgi:precorrin isomerase